MTRSAVAVALATTAAALAVPAAAGAHTGIDSRSPKAGSAVSRDLSLVKVTFEGRISDANLTVKRRGVKVSRGSGRLVRDNRQVRVRLRSSQRAGRYRATVRWLSADGHVLSSSWSFRLR